MSQFLYWPELPFLFYGFLVLLSMPLLIIVWGGRGERIGIALLVAVLIAMPLTAWAVPIMDPCANPPWWIAWMC